MSSIVSQSSNLLSKLGVLPSNTQIIEKVGFHLGATGDQLRDLQGYSHENGQPPADLMNQYTSLLQRYTVTQAAAQPLRYDEAKTLLKDVNALEEAVKKASNLAKLESLQAIMPLSQIEPVNTGAQTR